MKILWHASGTDRRRGKRLVAALRMDGHQVEKVILQSPIPRSAELLFFGFSAPANFPTLMEIENLMRFPGKIVGFGFEDDPTLDISRIPKVLRDRVDAWLKVSHEIPKPNQASTIRGVLGLLPPFLPRSLRVVPRLRWNLRKPVAVFFGGTAGPNIPGTSHNVRVEAVRKLKHSKMPFIGGIVRTGNLRPEYEADGLLVEGVSPSRHWQLLRTSLICLAIGGNNPISRRFFEILGAGSLAMTTGLENIRWLRGQLQAGIHYVALRDDLGDLEEKVDYYLAHPQEAREIAVRGREEYLRYYYPGKRRFNLLLWRDLLKSTGGVVPDPASTWHAARYAIRQQLGETLLPVAQVRYHMVGLITGRP